MNIVNMNTWWKIVERHVDTANQTHVKDHAKLKIIKEMVIAMMETTIADVNLMAVIVVILMLIWITAQNVNVLTKLTNTPKMHEMSLVQASDVFGAPKPRNPRGTSPKV